jgi:hypothetical protein
VLGRLDLKLRQGTVPLMLLDCRTSRICGMLLGPRGTFLRRLSSKSPCGGMGHIGSSLGVSLSYFICCLQSKEPRVLINVSKLLGLRFFSVGTGEY